MKTFFALLVGMALMSAKAWAQVSPALQMELVEPNTSVTVTVLPVGYFLAGKKFKIDTLTATPTPAAFASTFPGARVIVRIHDNATRLQVLQVEVPNAASYQIQRINGRWQLRRAF